MNWEVATRGMSHWRNQADRICWVGYARATENTECSSLVAGFANVTLLFAEMIDDGTVFCERTSRLLLNIVKLLLETIPFLEVAASF
jgi:hypothetical protein